MYGYQSARRLNVRTYISFLGSSTMFSPLTPSVNWLSSSVEGLTVSSATTVGTEVVAVEFEASGTRAASVLVSSVAAIAGAVLVAVFEGVSAYYEESPLSVAYWEQVVDGRLTLWILSFLSGEDMPKIPEIRVRMPFFSCRIDVISDS